MLRKKQFQVFIVTLIFSLIFTVNPIYAAENYKIWNGDNTSSVDSTKKWNITFNKEVSIESSKASINVYNQSTGEKVDINFSGDGKVISISPKTPYESGKAYALVVDENLKSKENKKINQPVKFYFKINEVKQQENYKNTINSYDELYNAVKKALANYESSITLKINNYDSNVYNLEVIDKILVDNPTLRSGYSGASGKVLNTNPATLTINFKYNDTKENLMEKEVIVDKKVSEIVASVVKADMKDYEKELALHDYLINNSKYDQRVVTGNMPDESYTAYGVLINGIGVCEGYAQAMNKLLAAAGIESIMAVGEANDGSGWVGHAWNIVKIGGQYYHVDSTWDDPVTKDGSNKLRHTYFNITDSQISKDHKWNKTYYPQCNSTTYNFNNLNITEKDDDGDTVIVIQSYDEFYNSIKNAVISGKSGVSLKVLEYDEKIYNVSDTLRKIVNETGRYGDYSWKYSSDKINNLQYISIRF